MNWLLTILLIFPDGSQTQTRAGLMVTKDICVMAAKGMGAQVAFESPEVQYFYTCTTEL